MDAYSQIEYLVIWTALDILSVAFLFLLSLNFFFIYLFRLKILIEIQHRLFIYLKRQLRTDIQI